MARFHRFSGVTKTIAAGVAQTITFPANEIEGSGVVAYDILFAGAGMDQVDVDRVRVMASGDTIMDVSIAQLRAWQEGTLRTGDVLATSATRLHVPLYMPDWTTRDERDSCQFPTGAQPQIEVDILATAPAASAFIGWTKTDVQPRFTSRLYSQVANIPASTNNGRVVFADGGIIRGLVMNTVGVQRARLVLSDREIFRVSGADFNGAATGDMLRAVRMDEWPQTITDPFFVPISANLQAAVGSSYLELDTGSGWAGATNELVVWSVVPLEIAQNGR